MLSSRPSYFLSSLMPEGFSYPCLGLSSGQAVMIQ